MAHCAKSCPDKVKKACPITPTILLNLLQSASLSPLCPIELQTLGLLCDLDSNTVSMPPDKLASLFEMLES